MRFFHRLGATEVSPDTICNMAGHVALSYVYGTSLDGFDPRTARDARSCIVVWGANPSASGPHVHEHWLREAPRPRSIVIDPIRTPTAEARRPAPPALPGSDAALAFAMLHVLGAMASSTRTSSPAHTVGWDELEPLLADCTPAWGEATTGVPARRIEEAARLYGEGPSLLWLGQALQRQPTGGNVMRACSLLPAVTGNLGKPGAGFLYLNWNSNATTLPRRCLSDRPALGRRAAAAHQPHGPDYLPGGPETHQALVCWNMNVAASKPAASAAPAGASARGSLHRGARSLPDRYHRLRRLRAAGGELPGVRRLWWRATFT